MTPKHECCALCQTETDETVDTPSYERKNYIDNAGQLCPECYSFVAANKEWHNLL